jgi:hypothetical protein
LEGRCEVRQVYNVVTCFLIIALCTPAFALNGPPQPETPIEATEAHRDALEEGHNMRATTVAGAVIFAANAADIITTRRGIAAGGVEGWNPGLYGRYAERIVPVKLAISAGETAAFHFIYRRNKWLAWGMVAGVVVGNAYAAIHNERVTARLR